MKKILLTQLFLFALPLLIYSQTIEVIPYGGFEWGGKVKLRYSEAKFKASGNYGITINLMTPQNIGLVLDFCHQPTYIKNKEYYPSTWSEEYKSNVFWYQIGGIKQVPVSSQIAFFGGMTLGAANLRVPDASPEADEWAFSMTGQIGTKIYLTDKLGLQFHLRMLMPVQFGGFNFYFNRNGPGTSADVGSYFVQGDVGGGIIFRLGTTSPKPVNQNNY